MDEPVSLDGFTFAHWLSGGFFSTSSVVVSKSGKSFVFKKLSKSILNDDLERFSGKLERVSSLSSSGIVPYSVVKVDEKNEEIILLRPFVQGISLADGGLEALNLSNSDIFRMWIRIINLYTILHGTQINPLYVLPSNIFISDNGSNVEITDVMPMTVAINIRNKTPNLLQIGFLPPEAFAQANGTLKISELSESWSFGILLHYMLAKKLPWKTSNFCTLVQDILSCNYHIDSSIPKEYQNIIENLLKLYPKERLSLENILEHYALPSNNTIIFHNKHKPILVHPQIATTPNKLSMLNSKMPSVVHFCPNMFEKNDKKLKVRSRSYPPPQLAKIFK